MLLSGAVLESAHWPLTVDVVAMVKVACSRHPVPLLLLLCNSSPFFFPTSVSQLLHREASHLPHIICSPIIEPCAWEYTTRNLLTASTEESWVCYHLPFTCFTAERVRQTLRRVVFLVFVDLTFAYGPTPTSVRFQLVLFHTVNLEGILRLCFALQHLLSEHVVSDLMSH